MVCGPAGVEHLGEHRRDVAPEHRPRPGALIPTQTHRWYWTVNPVAPRRKLSHDSFGRTPDNLGGGDKLGRPGPPHTFRKGNIQANTSGFGGGGGDNLPGKGQV